VKNTWESTLELYITHQACFQGHSSAEPKVKLERKNNNFVVMPDGMTCQLQPFDVSVNKPLRD
jgi:hypothetical protein